MSSAEFEVLINKSPRTVFSAIENLFLEFSVFLNYTIPHLVDGGSLAAGKDISAEVEILGSIGFETVGRILEYDPRQFRIAFGFATLAYYKDENVFAPVHERRRNARFYMQCRPDGPSSTTFRSGVVLQRRLFGGASASAINNMVIKKVQMISAAD
jgi:hypothetical protein